MKVIVPYLTLWQKVLCLLLASVTACVQTSAQDADPRVSTEIAKRYMTKPDEAERHKMVVAEYDKLIKWGLPRNGVRMGIQLTVSNNAPKEFANWVLHPALFLSSTNAEQVWPTIPVKPSATNLVDVYLPPPCCLCEIELLRPDGTAVPKTSKGKEFKAEDPAKYLGVLDLQRESGFLFDRVGSYLPAVPGRGYLLLDLFKVTEAGEYTLNVAWRAYIITNGKRVVTYFPSISKKIVF